MIVQMSGIFSIRFHLALSITMALAINTEWQQIEHKIPYSVILYFENVTESPISICLYLWLIEWIQSELSMNDVAQ